MKSFTLYYSSRRKKGMDLKLDVVTFGTSLASSNCTPEVFFFKSSSPLLMTGSSFITLVPKVKDPLHITDYRPISLIGCQYKVITKVLANRLIQVVPSIVSQVQTAYIKAFDSLDWKFLDHIMEQMGFTNKWRRWIHGCLDSAFRSMLVNGSPTKEFKIQKGLRQGDPLSPFLFITTVEALHVAIQEAKSKNIFEGVKVGTNGVDISH
ncbi:RNA-directed DNA polymerase, eukaryota, reverse transcriptase zinc-binding domain protein [Tanacetum coccineum]